MADAFLSLSLQPQQAPSAADATAAAALARVKGSLLGAPLRVTLVDGRVLQGRLHCLDWKQNIVLRDTQEVAHADDPTGRKALGLVAVEARHVSRYECAAAEGATAMPKDGFPVHAEEFRHVDTVPLGLTMRSVGLVAPSTTHALPYSSPAMAMGA